jgi:hypothetical protein
MAMGETCCLSVAVALPAMNHKVVKAYEML